MHMIDRSVAWRDLLRDLQAQDPAFRYDPGCGNDKVHDVDESASPTGQVFNAHSPKPDVDQPPDLSEIGNFLPLSIRCADTIHFTRGRPGYALPSESCTSDVHETVLEHLKNDRRSSGNNYTRGTLSILRASEHASICESESKSASEVSAVGRNIPRRFMWGPGMKVSINHRSQVDGWKILLHIKGSRQPSALPGQIPAVFVQEKRHRHSYNTKCPIR